MLERVKYSFGLLLLIVAFFIAYNISINSFNGETFVSIQELINLNNRDIANVKTNNYLIKDHQLLSTSPLGLLTKAVLKIPPKESSDPIVIKLGHFSLSNSPDKKEFACHLYHEVILTYEALSLPRNDKSESNTNPLMTIKANCTIDSTDFFHLKAIQILPQKITQDPPGDGMRVSEDGSYTLHFENMQDSWPSVWHFKMVQLKSNSGSPPTQEFTRSALPINDQAKLDITNWIH